MWRAECQQEGHTAHGTMASEGMSGCYCARRISPPGGSGAFGSGLGVSENRGPSYRNRIPIIRIPKLGIPNFRKLPVGALQVVELRSACAR